MELMVLLEMTLNALYMEGLPQVFIQYMCTIVLKAAIVQV